MFYEDEEDDFDMAGETTVPEDDDTEVTTEENESDTADDEEVELAKTPSDKEDDEPDEEENESEDDEEEQKKNNQIKALDAERARRKQAEKELKELKAKLNAEDEAKKAEETIAKEREEMKAKMLEGDLIDEDTANKLLEVFGNDVIKNRLDNQERSEKEAFEEEFQELKREERFMDADVYKPQMRELVKKGLTARQAYMASISDAKFDQIKKDLRVEAEQRLLNSREKADKIDPGVQESKSEIQGTTYSKEEKRLAKETGLPVKEVHKRLKMDSIEDFEKLS